MYPNKNSWARTYHTYVFVCNSMLLLELGDRIKESLPALREWEWEKNDGVGFSFTKRTFLADYPLILVQAELGLGLAGFACLAGVRKRAVQDRWITDYIEASLAGFAWRLLLRRVPDSLSSLNGLNKQA